MISDVKSCIEKLKSPNTITGPRLDVLRTSDRSDSDAYIKRKRKILESAGIEFHVHDVCNYSRKEFLTIITAMNSDPKIQSILVQFPLGHELQKYFKTDEIMELVDWRKDVDGFHPFNLVHSAMKSTKHKLYFDSCTPLGVMRLLKEMEIKLSGLDVVLIGKSRVVGIPLLHQLLAVGATVHCCHRTTEQLAQKCNAADVVVVAAGHSNLVKCNWIKPGAVVIDIGINYDETGHLIGGDVDYRNVKDVAGFVTPVPGGIGPLTIAALAENVLKSWKYNINKSV